MSLVNVTSEIAPLKKVLLHTPGPEIEIMSPESAFELLYDDILYRPDAVKQHSELSRVLQFFAQSFEVEDLLADILADQSIRKKLLTDLTRVAGYSDHMQDLLGLSTRDLARQLFIGTPLIKDTLTRFLSGKNYALPPLPNFFYMRDSAMVVNKHIVLGSMANDIRRSESIILKYVFSHHPAFKPEGFFLDITEDRNSGATFEGGDVLVIREDVILIGMGERTTPQGVDYLIEQFEQDTNIKHVFAVSLPKTRSMIHLDMIFTMIDRELCVAYPPMILNNHALDVYHITLKNGRNRVIKQHENLLGALATIGIRLQPVKCGGDNPLAQDREQWQSGANFFAIGPGKIIGYDRNPETLKALNSVGIPTIMAKDVIDGHVNIEKMDKFAIAISSSELVRGGGGCRCMTMPILRDALN
jgi:arginine deiminase